MPQNKSPFINFLKNLYWPVISQSSYYELDLASAKTGKKKKEEFAADRSVSSVLRQVEDELSGDIDEIIPARWREKIRQSEKIMLSSGKRKAESGRNYMNREINPHAHIDNFFDDAKKLLPRPSGLLLAGPGNFLLASAVVLALLLSLGIVRLNQDLARTLVDFNDRIVLAPFNYLLPAPAPGNDMARSETITDKNILGSYIVNNREILKPGKNGEAVYQVNPGELDGRVAGAFAPAARPSPALESVSAGPAPFGSRLKNKLENLIEQGIEFQMDLSRKMGERLEKWLE